MFKKKDWEAGEAVIVESHVKHHGGSQGQGNLREWVADVRPANGAPFRAVIQLPNLALDFREPGPGDVVGVLIDSKDSSVKFDKSDPRLSLKAAHAQEQTRFESAAADSFGSLAPPAGTNHAVTTSSTISFEGMQVVDPADAATFLRSFLGGDSPADGQVFSGLPDHTTTKSVAERLSALQSLKDSGALTEVEYDMQRQRIIESI